MSYTPSLAAGGIAQVLVALRTPFHASANGYSWPLPWWTIFARVGRLDRKVEELDLAVKELTRMIGDGSFPLKKAVSVS